VALSSCASLGGLLLFTLLLLLEPITGSVCSSVSSSLIMSTSRERFLREPAMVVDCEAAAAGDLELWCLRVQRTPIMGLGSVPVLELLTGSFDEDEEVEEKGGNLEAVGVALGPLNSSSISASILRESEARARGRFSRTSVDLDFLLLDFIFNLLLFSSGNIRSEHLDMPYLAI